MKSVKRSAEHSRNQPVHRVEANQRPHPPLSPKIFPAKVQLCFRGGGFLVYGLVEGERKDMKLASRICGGGSKRFTGAVMRIRYGKSQIWVLGSILLSWKWIQCGLECAETRQRL